MKNKNNLLEFSKISIHTFMISRPITGVMWNAIKKYMYSDSEMLISSEHGTKNEIRFFKYRNQGINLRVIWYGSKHDTKRHRLDIVVNPRQLLGDMTYVGLFEITEENLKMIDRSLESVFRDLNWHGRYWGFSLHINSFILSRVDVCINIYMPHIGMYVDAHRRCFTPKGFKKHTNKNGTIPKHSLYLKHKGKKLNIQVYNKYAHMLKDEYDLRPDELAKAENLLRYEVQLRRKSIYEYVRNDKIPLQLIGGLAKSLAYIGCEAPNILNKYAKKTFGDQHYVDSKSIQKRIYYSGIPFYQEQEINRYLDLMDKMKDADKVFKKIDKIWIESIFNKLKINTMPLYSRYENALARPPLSRIVRESYKQNKYYHDDIALLYQKLETSSDYMIIGNCDKPKD